MRGLLATVIFIIFLSSPLSAQEIAGTIQQIKKTGILKIGYRKSLPPMSFLNKDSVPSGYSLDICSHIVTEVESRLNTSISVEYIPVNAEDRFNALIENKIDILCGATTKTLDRQERVDFTQLTFVTGAAFMTLKGSQLENNFDGKKIGVVSATTTATALKKLFQETEVKAEIVLLNSTEQGVTELKEGKIDAFSADQVVLIGLILESGSPTNFTVLPDLYSFEPFALAVRRNDADFRLIADRVISYLYRSNEIITIYDKWFSRFSRKIPSAFEAMISLLATPEK